MFGLVGSWSNAYSQIPQNAPRVESKEQSKDTPQTKYNSYASPKNNSPLPTISLKPSSNINTKKASDDAQYTSDEASEYWAVFGRRVKVTDTLLVVFTGLLFVATVFLYFATRSLVESAENTASTQMRAYCTVIVNDGIFQESGRNIRFEARPRIVNTGNTPAHKVRYRAAAAILPNILPDDFTFPLPQTEIGGAVLGPHHHFDMSATVNSFVLDADVESIKRCNDNALHAWGIVTYIDAFGKERQTKF